MEIEQLPWEFPGMKTKSESLPFGDYSVDGFQKRLIAVERKTAEDFTGSMTTRRTEFERVLIGLQAYQRSIVIVECDYGQFLDDFQGDHPRSLMRYTSLLGTLAAWQGRYNIMFAGNRARAQEFAARYLLKAAQDIAAPVMGLRETLNT